MSPSTESVTNKSMKYSIESENSYCLQHRRMHCQEALPENDRMRVEAIELMQDVARHVLELPIKRISSGSSRHATTMRRVVDDIRTRHSILFNGMVKRVVVSDIDNVVATFQTILAEICADGVNNWGRIVSVYTFAGRLVKHCVDIGIVSADQPEKVDSVAYLLGSHIADQLGCWIRNNGGWDQFETFFTPHQTAESSLWRGLIAALGIGAVAAVIAVR